MHLDERKVSQLLDEIPVPMTLLDAAILEGKHRAKIEKQAEKRNRRIKVFKYSFTALLIISCLGASLIAGSRWSPVLASSLSQIPFVSYLVEFVAGSSDKGLLDIVENEYYEVIDKTATANDVSLTVNGVIADEYGLVIFYEIDAPNNPYEVDIHELNIQLNSQPISAGISYGSLGSGDTEGRNIHQVSIESYEPLIYGDKQFELQMSFTDVNQSAITIPFELSKPIAETKHFDFQQEIIVSGQRLWLKELSVTPLRAQLTLHADEQNSMQLLDVGIVELIDEKGESWGKGTNGVIGWGSFRDGDYKLKIQSNYFRSPEQLKLRLAEISALPKGEDYIEVDFDRQEVIYQPEQVDLQFQILPKGISYSLYENTERFKGSLISQGIDAAGEAVYNYTGSSRVSPEKLSVQMSFSLENVKNPVRFYINSYPSYLTDEVEINIPLD